MRRLREAETPARGVDLLASPFTSSIGSIVDRAFVRESMAGVEAVLHAATLHKPHVATHSRQAFVDVNITGTLHLLEEAAAAGVKSFVFTSTTSAFGQALRPEPGAPAAWIDEDLRGSPKNIYGASKTAAEDLCQLFFRLRGLACVVLRTSRFFPEEDDDPARRAAYADANAKANEFLYRRVDIEDAVAAHLLALERAPSLGFERLIISATPPFDRSDLAALRADAPALVAARFPGYVAEYERRGWRMFPSLDRVYSNARARRTLGWAPRYDFARVLEQLKAGEAIGSELARVVGAKGYHAGGFFEGGPYPVV